MKAFKYISLLAFFFGISGFSQNPSAPEGERRIMENREFGKFVASQTPVLNFPNPQIKKELKPGNQIFIEQIGADNYISIYTSSENSDLKLFQNGVENYISFRTEAKNIEGTIIQEGNNNSSFDFTTNSNQDISANLLQQGDNLHFERFGANSIGNNLKFIQTGDTKTIIVRNLQ